MRLEIMELRAHLAEVRGCLRSALRERAEDIAELRRAVQAHQETLTQVVEQLRSLQELSDL